MMRITLFISIVLLSAPTLADEPLPPIPPIPRLIPPEGIELSEEEQAKLESRLASIDKRIAALHDDPLLPDALIFTKAVRYALDLHEFYDAKKDTAKAHKLLDEAEKRLADLENGKHSWTTATRLVVRGYASFDGVQPYGVVFPKDFDPKRKEEYPIYLWLHGRGDKSTDLHFIHERMTQIGQLGVVDAVVIHPFGRQCVGFKSAGETDVISALYRFEDSARADGLPVNLERTVLLGFSMGGAGAWHIGAHMPGRFLAVAPGAGFAETARYTNTDPNSVPWYERKLWGLYDVPCYTRNLFNIDVIAYSGENDKQIQSARVMEEAFAAEGHELTHLIGPGVEHQYEPKTLQELKSRLAELAELRKRVAPSHEFLQTRTLRYSSNGNVEAARLQRHWEDSRIDAVQTQEGKTFRYDISTKNISAFQFQAESRYHSATIDRQEFPFPAEVARRTFLRFQKENDKWDLVLNFKSNLHKQAGLGGPPLCGPIDDAFVNSFIVVAPSGKSKHPLVQRWIEFEMQHFIERWRALMRGDVPVKKDTEITQREIQYTNLVCFGDPASNALIRRAAEKLPITWAGDQIVAGENRWPAKSHVPALIYPNPLHTRRDIYADPPPGGQVGFDNPHYLVINSGLTFREAHDKTNSQQNPKLPDWAVIDLSQPPDDKAPGRIAAAGFFDEEWKYQENGDQ